MERAEATTALIGGSPSGVWGSGVVVDRAAGVIITNAHVVNSFARDRDLHAWVRGAGGAGGWERVRVEVVHKVAAGTFPDIAVLRWAPAGTAAAVTNPSSGSAGISSSKRADTADAAGQPPVGPPTRSRPPTGRLVLVTDRPSFGSAAYHCRCCCCSSPRRRRSCTTWNASNSWARLAS